MKIIKEIIIKLSLRQVQNTQRACPRLNQATFTSLSSRQQYICDDMAVPSSDLSNLCSSYTQDPLSSLQREYANLYLYYIMRVGEKPTMALWSWTYCHLLRANESDSVRWYIQESLVKFSPLILKIDFQVEDYRKYNGLWELRTHCIWTDNPYFGVLRRGRQPGTVWIYAGKLFDIHYTRYSLPLTPKAKRNSLKMESSAAFQSTCT